MVGNVLHDSTNRGRVQRLERNPQDELDVTPSVPFRPVDDVVSRPEESVDGIEQVEESNGDDHAGTGQLAVLVEESQGHPAAHSSAQVEEDPEEYVGHGAWGRAVITAYVGYDALEIHTEAYLPPLLRKGVSDESPA